jgi:Putative zinc-finger
MRPWTQMIVKLQEWITNAGRGRPDAAGPPTMLRCHDIVDLILAYLEGNLDPGEQQAFEIHIADCVNCWRFLQTYCETISMGRQLHEEVIPPDVRERLETFLRSRLTRTS